VSQIKESNGLGLLSLLASSSTLICCALPALFVSLGAGATLASIVNVFPELIIISKYKIYISAFALLFLIVAGILIKNASVQPCPTDPNLRDICIKTRKKSKIIYIISVFIFAFASIFTYIVPKLI
tara:strand:+ start:946 stop:1323 length:378 start_codon:yes stop_codon:yes gene_type:complete